MQDLFICGTCQTSFNELDQFIDHKQSPCRPLTVEQSMAEQGQETEGQGHYQAAAVVEGQDFQAADTEGQYVGHQIDPGIIMDQIAGEALSGQGQEETTFVSDDGQQSFALQTASFVAEGHAIVGQGQFGAELVEGDLQVAVNEADETGVLSLVEESEGGQELCQVDQIISVAQPADSKGENVVAKIYQLKPLEGGGFELVPRPDLPLPSVDGVGAGKDGVFTAPEPVKPKKKVGRPKRGEEKRKRSPPPPKESDRLPLPEKSADGTYCCKRCHNSFRRERHYNSHKCFGNSIYADLSKPDVAGDDDLGGYESPAGSDGDDRSEYTPDMDEPTPSRLSAMNIIRSERQPVATTSAKRTAQTADLTNEDNVATLPLIANDADDVGIVLEPVGNSTKRQRRQQTSEIDEVPFTEEEKQAFDRALNIDLSGVDHLFREHFIGQEVNQYAPSPLNQRDSHLSIYSCNTCDKVFKSTSQMRQHCLTHTNLRPYKCPKCEYCSNSKGNLYTHMKKHLGWYYNCSKCSFRTVNRSHYVEHEAVHTNQKTKCPVCNKNYSTQKSLINHLRKYHPDKVDDYRKKPRSIVGQAILHQCEICNRKFKKNIDRDRHLFMHNIITSEWTYECVLCDYSSHKKNLLEKHLYKHRFIYQCTSCPLKFLSATKLKVHLDSEHGSMDIQLFDQCIGKSLYLPEPDGTVEPLKPNLQNIDEQCRKLLFDFEQKNWTPQEKEKQVEGMITEDIAVESATEALTGEMASAEVGLENQSAATLPSEEDEQAMGQDAILDARDSECWDIITRMNYLLLNKEVYEKIRATFGDSECEHCGSRFWRNEDHNKHLLTHTNLRLYPCDECSYKSESKEYLRRHIARYHIFESTYTCDSCDFTSTDKTEFWKHKMSHQKKTEKEIDCPRCGSKFDSKALAMHIAVQHPDMTREEIVRLTGVQLKILGKIGQRTFQCSQCSAVLRTSADLRKHLSDVHNVPKQYGCQYCPYTCNNIHGLKSHLVRHSVVKPYVCEVCHRSYKSRTAARWHARTHQYGRLFKCNKCPYEAIQKTHLARHMETHLVRKRYRCHLCDYSANTAGYLRVHYTKTHKGVELPNISQDTSEGNQDGELPTRVYKCESCDYVFGNLYDIRRHMKTRHRISEDLVQFTTPAADAEAEAEAEDVSQTSSTYTTLPIACSDKATDEAVMMDDATREMDESMEASKQVVETVTAELVASDGTPSLAMDEKAASAVSLLQELAGLQPDVLAGGQALQVQGVDGQILVVQQQGDDIIISTPDQDQDHQQYVITYVNEGQVLDSTNQLLNLDGRDSAEFASATEMAENLVGSSLGGNVVETMDTG